jgi:hypothetical protein
MKIYCPLSLIHLLLLVVLPAIVLVSVLVSVSASESVASGSAMVAFLYLICYCLPAPGRLVVCYQFEYTLLRSHQSMPSGRLHKVHTLDI